MNCSGFPASHFTKGLIRERIEDRFKVPSGSLKPRKKVINAAIEAAMDADDEDVDMVDAKEEGDGMAREVTPTSAKEKHNTKKQTSDDADRAVSLLAISWSLESAPQILSRGPSHTVFERMEDLMRTRTARLCRRRRLRRGPLR